uniref:Uncharacterized protein n=1 Tax=Pelusios castaneus TaxID=367368 RepID=A0A8C8RGL7_9SAUR
KEKTGPAGLPQNPEAGRQFFPKTKRGFKINKQKRPEILLRRPSVQTTCSGQCCCTVVCTLVRLGKGKQRHGLLGTPVAIAKEKTIIAPFRSHIQYFSSQEDFRIMRGRHSALGMITYFVSIPTDKNGICKPMQELSLVRFQLSW